MTRHAIPAFAADYPEVAKTLEHTRLPFYCMNCQRKRETTYLTPDFGGLCDECIGEMNRAPLEVFTLEYVEFDDASLSNIISIHRTYASALMAAGIFMERMHEGHWRRIPSGHDTLDEWMVGTGQIMMTLSRVTAC